MSQLVDEVAPVVGAGREDVGVDVDYDVEPADTQKFRDIGEPFQQSAQQYFRTLCPWRKIS